MPPVRQDKVQLGKIVGAHGRDAPMYRGFQNVSEYGDRVGGGFEHHPLQKMGGIEPDDVGVRMAELMLGMSHVHTFKSVGPLLSKVYAIGPQQLVFHPVGGGKERHGMVRMQFRHQFALLAAFESGINAIHCHYFPVSRFFEKRTPSKSENMSIIIPLFRR